MPGLELARHYHPASPRDVGGDFYDVFRLDARRWGFFLGDVCGKGAAAAVTLAGGGHPPAWHLTPGKESVRAQPVELPGGTLVGVLADPLFVTTTVRLAPGSCLLLYTDGLTEARTRGEVGS